MIKITIRIFLLSIVILISACSSVNNHPNYGRYSMDHDAPPLNEDIDVSNIPDAIPKYEPLSKYGNPRSYVVRGKRYYVKKTSKGYHERGIASWYGMKFHQHRTSSGERYDLYAMTAASRTLPLPTYARVTNLQNGRSAIVKVNDRGPFEKNRVMDLSYAAAKKLGVTAHGTALVDIVAINPKNYNPYETHVFGPAATIRQPGHPVLYLQLGAFSQLKNAKALEQRVKAYTNKSVRIKTLITDKGPIYKVQIGPISINASDQISHGLSKAGLGTPIAAVE